MTSSTPRVGVVGGANVDLIASCEELPTPGATILARSLRQLPGGKGANQAVALAALGAVTSFIGCLGVDENGRWLARHLADRGVSTDLMTYSATHTGVALIPVDDAGENMIIVVPGANAEISLSTTPLEDFDVVLAQLESPLDVVTEAARRSRAFVLNAAPRRAIPLDLATSCDVIIVNEIEATALDLSVLEHCVVTLGARGAVTFCRGREVASATPPSVDVLDTVGAGDAFCAAYTLQFAMGASLDDALRYAVVAGALATRGVGAQGALPTDEEVREWL